LFVTAVYFRACVGYKKEMSYKKVKIIIIVNRWFINKQTEEEEIRI
jgi:hypothetical protein